LKCGAGEGWRRTVKDCVKNEVLHRAKEERNIPHTKNEERLIELVTSCLSSTLLKERDEGREDEE
jgi:hypothetical protein